MNCETFGVGHTFAVLVKAFLFPAAQINRIEHAQKCGVYKQPRFPQSQCPFKWNAPQISQEQRRVANRKQQAAAIAHNKYKKHHGMRAARAVRVGLKQGTNQQHAGAGCAKKICKHSSNRKYAGVHSWCCGKTAAHGNSAGDYK